MMEDIVASARGGGRQLFNIQLSFLVISGAFVSLRAYIKIFIVKKVSLDDYLVFFAMLMYTIYGAVALHGVVNGVAGKTLLEITADDAAVSLRAWYICEVLYAPVTLAIRASVSVFLLRLASRRLHRAIIWLNVVLVATFSMVLFFFIVFQCKPVSFFWRHVYGEVEGICIDPMIVPYSTIAYSIVSALSDWSLGLLPVAMLWHVRINRRTKAIIAILLSMGIVAGIAPIIRIPYIRFHESSLEFLYSTIDTAIWSILEPGLGLIAACAATFRPLFKTWSLGWSSHRDLSGRDTPFAPPALSRGKPVHAMSGGSTSHGHTSGRRSNEASDSSRIELSANVAKTESPNPAIPPPSRLLLGETSQADEPKEEKDQKEEEEEKDGIGVGVEQSADTAAISVDEASRRAGHPAASVEPPRPRSIALVAGFASGEFQGTASIEHPDMPPPPGA